MSTYGVDEMCLQGFSGETRRKQPLGRPGVDGKVTLRWIFRKWDVRAWTRSIWLRIGTGGGHL